ISCSNLTVIPHITIIFPYTTLFRSIRDQGLRVRKDGSTFEAEVIITALRDDTGKIRGFSKVTRDITDLIRSREFEAEKIAAQKRSEEHTSELQSPDHLVCRLLLEKK